MISRHNSFWVTNRLANPVLGLLLRSPVGAHFGQHLGLVTYDGRRSGKRHQLIVQYARKGTVVWIVPGQPDRKTWWHNFSTTNPIKLRLAGREFDGRAIALRGDDNPEEVRRGFAAYLHQLPRAAKSLEIDPASDPDSRVSGGVVVRVDLLETSDLNSAGPGRGAP
jgi:hypothetical protein